MIRACRFVGQGRGGAARSRVLGAGHCLSALLPQPRHPLGLHRLPGSLQCAWKPRQAAPCSSGSRRRCLGAPRKVSLSPHPVGVNVMLRKIAVAAASKPAVEIKQEGDTFYIRTSTSVRTTEINFKVGDEFEEQTVDGRPCKVGAVKESLGAQRPWPLPGLFLNPSLHL